VEEVSTIGLDVAKQVFHAHGADAAGATVFSRRITRQKLIAFFASQPRCTVAMEACAGSHHWGRELMKLGHEVRLIPPAYVKPFVKRQKSDAADAAAICEAAQRPTMRFAINERLLGGRKRSRPPQQSTGSSKCQQRPGRLRLPQASILLSKGWTKSAVHEALRSQP
jgi:transposase